MKKLLIIITLCLLTACSSTHYQYTDKNLKKSVSLQKDKVFIKKFSVAYKENRVSGTSPAINGAGFLSKDGMEKLMQSTILSSLKSSGVYADANDDAVYEYDVFIDAARSYMAFSKDKYVGLDIRKVDIKVFKDGTLFAKKVLEGGGNDGLMGVIQTKPAIDCGHNRGFVQNLKTIAKTATAQKGVSEEIEDVKYCGRAIAATIEKLGS